MKRGYIRVSTKKQGRGTSLEEQRTVLENEGCTEFYTDTFSGRYLDRPEFSRLCQEVQPGDTVVITKMDRIARTETEAYTLMMNWVQNGIRVHVLNIGLLEDTPTGRLILHVMLAFAEFERDMIFERVLNGRLYKRETDPNYREGRKPKFTVTQLDHAMELLTEHSYNEVAALTGISRATLCREARKRGYRKNRRELGVVNTAEGGIE